MAIRKIEDAGGAITTNPPFITITDVTGKSPKASARIAAVPEGEQVDLMFNLLECGAEAFDAAATSTTVRLLEKQIAGFDEQLAETLEETLTEDRTVLTQKLAEILAKHEAKLGRAFNLYLDPDSAKGIQETVGKRLEVAGKDIEKRVRRLLDDGDESALGAVVKELRTEIRDATAEIVKQIGARHAVMTKTTLSGRPYEIAVTEKLTHLSQLTGDQVQHTGDAMGVMKRRTGDAIVILDPEVTKGEDIRVVAEAKRRDPAGQALSVQSIALELGRARKNREAEAAIFVAESASMLPQGSPFGQVSACDFFVAYDPTNDDDLGLAVALRLARIAALKECASDGENEIDLEAAEDAVAELKQLHAAFGEMLSVNVTIRKATEKSDLKVGDLKDRMLGAIRKIDRALRGE